MPADAPDVFRFFKNAPGASGRCGFPFVSSNEVLSLFHTKHSPTLGRVLGVPADAPDRLPSHSRQPLKRIIPLYLGVKLLGALAAYAVRVVVYIFNAVVV